MEGDARWIDRLSGPGPFWALGVNLVVACGIDRDGPLYARGDISSCDDRAADVRSIVELRGRYLWKLSGPLFTDTPGDQRDMGGLMLDVLASTRLHPMLDVGAGVGYIGLWGDGFEAQHRFTIIPVSTALRPFAFRVPPDYEGTLGFWQRAVSIKYEIITVVPGYSGVDFGNAVTSYSTKVEYVSSVGITIDLRF
jgi:hypothetical protein